MAAIPVQTNVVDQSTVFHALESDQLVHARQGLLERRRLSRRTLILMWGLRFYAVFMLGVVGYQVAQSL